MTTTLIRGVQATGVAVADDRRRARAGVAGQVDATASGCRLQRARRVGLVAAILALSLQATPALAVADPADRLADPAAEARAENIGRELRCMVCQNQSIEDSDADLARDLRRLVREQVAAGRDDAAVMRFVHDRYGDFVLLRPPVNATTALLWGAPAIALGAGLLLVFGLRRRNRVAAPPLPLTAAERERLARIGGGGTA